MAHTYRGEARYTAAAVTDEIVHEHAGEPSLVERRFTRAWTGGFIGESTGTWLIMELANGTAEFTGHERVTGVMDGKRGGFILRHDGTVEPTAAGVLTASACFIVADSAWGDLAEMTGAGHATEARDGGNISGLLQFEFDL